MAVGADRGGRPLGVDGLGGRSSIAPLAVCWSLDRVAAPLRSDDHLAGVLGPRVSRISSTPVSATWRSTTSRTCWTSTTLAPGRADGLQQPRQRPWPVGDRREQDRAAAVRAPLRRAIAASRLSSTLPPERRSRSHPSGAGCSSRRERGHPDGAGALDHELRLGEQRGHRVADLVLGDHRDLVEPALDQRQRQLAGRLTAIPSATVAVGFTVTGSPSPARPDRTRRPRPGRLRPLPRAAAT